MENTDMQSLNIHYLSESIDKVLNLGEKITLIDRKNEIDMRIASNIQANMIRHLYIIIDNSFFMKSNDFKPNRLALTISALKNLIPSFFDKNPLSYIGLACMEEGICKPLSDLSPNPVAHLIALTELKINTEKEISLQNALEHSIKIFKEAPLYSHKEILFLLSATSTCDPGDIFSTIEKIEKLMITCSIIHFSGSSHISQFLADKTEGKFEVPLDEEQFKNMINNYANPTNVELNKTSIELIEIGFPIKYFEENEGEGALCCCHNEKKFQFYECPYCKSRVCDIPTVCPICKINLFSSSHLARTSRNEIKVPKFDLKDNIQELRENLILKCYGCESKMPSNLRLQYSKCTNCSNIFCLECDIFIHDGIFSCPGCI